MRSAALIAGTLAVAGCYSIDIVSPTRNAPPSVVMSLSVVHADISQYRLDVFYTRGTDAEGAARPMTDSLLLVNDEPVTPFARGVLRNLEYSFMGSRPAGEAETLHVRLPVAVGVPAPATVAIVIPARLDDDLIELPEGADLTLTIPMDAAEPPVTSSGNWRLEVVRASGSLFSILGQTPPPASFVVPASLLPVAVGDTLTANFTRSLSREFGTALPVFTRLFEFTQTFWRVPVIAAP